MNYHGLKPVVSRSSKGDSAFASLRAAFIPSLKRLGFSGKGDNFVTTIKTVTAEPFTAEDAESAEDRRKSDLRVIHNKQISSILGVLRVLCSDHTGLIF